jgi:hypothetical protein
MISAVIEVPELLHDAVGKYLDSRPDWDRDRVMTAALGMFLIQQNQESNPDVLRAFLNAMLPEAV